MTYLRVLQDEKQAIMRDTPGDLFKQVEYNNIQYSYFHIHLYIH